MSLPRLPVRFFEVNLNQGQCAHWRSCRQFSLRDRAPPAKVLSDDRVAFQHDRLLIRVSRSVLRSAATQPCAPPPEVSAPVARRPPARSRPDQAIICCTTISVAVPFTRTSPSPVPELNTCGCPRCCSPLVRSKVRTTSMSRWVVTGLSEVLAAHAALLPTQHILYFSGSEYNPDQHNATQI